MTLVEVVVSMALMAILLTSVVMAYGRHSRQIRTAHQRLVAIQACDEMIAYWMERPSAFEGRTTGLIPRRPQLRWRVLPIASSAADSLESTVVRWEILAVGAKTASQPIVQVDVLVPQPDPESDG